MSSPLKSVLGAFGASGLAASLALASAPVPATLPGGWGIRWMGDPARGLATFEGVEEDRSNSHPGADHILVENGAFRFNMHMVDRDGGDRQRHEVKGINLPGQGDIKILQGETWVFIYEMFIPTSLTGGGRFTHIFQQKMVSDAGSSGGPVLTLSTSSNNTLLPRVVGGFKPLPLSQVWDKWVEIELESKFDFSAAGGYVRWSVKDLVSGTKLAEERQAGSVWANEGSRDRRVRPKWGIYRSLGSEGLKDCHLLVRNLRAYHKGEPYEGAVGLAPPAAGGAPAMRAAGPGVLALRAGDAIGFFDVTGRLLRRIPAR